jgi:flagellar basal body-associated protein FliL
MNDEWDEEKARQAGRVTRLRKHRVGADGIGCCGRRLRHAGCREHRLVEKPAEITYVAFQQPFTSNLRDSGSFAQLSLSIATRDDPRAAEVVKTNEAALRSVVLMTIADQDAMALATTAGKQQLQDKLREVMNAALKSKDGQAGIDSVYFTSFVIQ